MSEVKTYKFSTFQEFFDRVPSDRMLDCLSELAVVLVKSKQTLELIARASEVLESGEPLMRLPELEWIDDGKGRLETHFMDPTTGKELLGMSLANDGEPTFTVPE